MKKIVLSIAMCLLAGGMMAQSASDKAAAKEAAKALKAAKKEAKANLAAAQKVKDDIYARIADKEKPASEDEVLSACKMGQGIVVKAINSGHLDEDVLGQAYKLSGDLAVYPLNIYLNAAKDKLAFDTAHYYDNLWGAMAFHAAWNYTQNIIFGLPNSGIVSEYSIFTLEAASARNGLFYNVNFGVEGSIGATAMLFILAAVIIYINRNKHERNDIWAEEEEKAIQKRQLREQNDMESEVN